MGPGVRRVPSEGLWRKEASHSGKERMQRPCLFLTFKMEGVPSVLKGRVCQSTWWIFLDLCQSQRPLCLKTSSYWE